MKLFETGVADETSRQRNQTNQAVFQHFSCKNISFSPLFSGLSLFVSSHLFLIDADFILFFTSRILDPFQPHFLPTINLNLASFH